MGSCILVCGALCCVQHITEYIVAAFIIPFPWVGETRKVSVSIISQKRLPHQLQAGVYDEHNAVVAIIHGRTLARKWPVL